MDNNQFKMKGFWDKYSKNPVNKKCYRTITINSPKTWEDYHKRNLKHIMDRLI